MIANMSGSGTEPQPDFICSAISTISVGIFSPLRTLIGQFDCRRRFLAISLLYTITFEDRGGVALTEDGIDETVVADLFRVGESIVQISICSEISMECDPDSQTVDIENVTVTVTPHTGRLFPYGEVTRDPSFRGVLDGAVPLYPPSNIPFFSSYYTSLHVSTLQCIVVSITDSLGP